MINAKSQTSMINREIKSSFALRSSGNRAPRVMAPRTVSNIPAIKAAACTRKAQGLLAERRRIQTSARTASNYETLL